MFCPLHPPNGHFMYDYRMHNKSSAPSGKLIVLMLLMLLFADCCSRCYGHYHHQQQKRLSVLASLFATNVINSELGGTTDCCFDSNNVYHNVKQHQITFCLLFFYYEHGGKFSNLSAVKELARITFCLQTAFIFVVAVLFVLLLIYPQG